ncbi:hypothetical protein P153DRAFT_368621 [Dothidotthia symphoricarpi CBS 119687]|uniref:Uncharacterized protein n=1 Tax=Dothidotthia symphoricarpi CBS 119687 TaxID=1392245 RepID=A0A6A6A905_9PLEO|nr:uncharacterized protein P153DRAFT_368621 [Dothidotthia symphoricarpi CBS 119687]KAF2127308.1 hypothetical protein P153DRAFT_368621 [Dothidotthia symphoricarpi CBS 119687]
MDFDNRVQLSIRRSPRAALEYQTAVDDRQYEHDDPYDATPPPIPRRGPVPMEKTKVDNPRAAPSPHFNPLRAHPVAIDTGTTTPARHRYSHPFRSLISVQPEPEPEPEPTPVVEEPECIPRRHPSGLRSYKNPRRPLYLRQRTSLETIASVRTTASITPSEDDPDLIGYGSPSPDLSTLDYEDVAFPTPVPTETSSLRSSSPSLRRPSTPTSPYKEPVESGNRSPKSLLQRIKFNKTYTSESAVPGPLIIQRKISFDRISTPSSSSNSAINVPIGQPSISRDQNFQRSQSQSSSEWSASSFDISCLTEAELKKCAKKGINPALFAEMKAARKGKWASPIAGNTFL